MGYIIVFLIGALVIALLLAAFVVPIVMASNHKKLKEMDKMIADFEDKKFSTAEEKAEARKELKKELVKVKSKITTDKEAIEKARDKISIL